MDKTSQREYWNPSGSPDSSGGPRPSSPKSPGALHGFIAGLWNGWTGANLSPEEYLQIQQIPPEDRVNWLHRSNLPPELRRKFNHYYRSGHGVNRSLLYKLMRYVNRVRNVGKRK